MAFAKRFWRNQVWRNQEGVVESTLVLIPLLVLFLIAVDLIIAINFRNLDQNYVQGEATSRALTGVIAPEDELLTSSSGFSFDSLRLLITHRRRALPLLTPDLPFLKGEGARSTELSGIAVMEVQP